MTVKRFDRSEIDKVEATPLGGLRVPARPTRAGIFVYRNGDGSTRRELRAPEEVFNEDSLKSLRGAPVTILHPEGEVTAANYRQLAVGHVSDVVAPDSDGIHVAAPLYIQDAKAVADVNSGALKELSCGYECDLDPMPGVWQGQPYDASQKRIRYNHVAAGPVGWGRAGASASLRLDASDAIEVENKTVSHEGRTMKTVRIDGIDYEIGSDAHLQAVERRHAAQEQKIREQDTRIGALTAEASEHKTRADKADTDLKAARDPKVIHSLVVARADMLDKGRRVSKRLGVRFDDAAAAATDEGGILLQMLKMIEPTFTGEGMTPDMIKGYALAKVSSLLGDESEEIAAGEEPGDMGGGQGPGADTGNMPPPGRTDGSRGGRADAAGARAVASRETGRGPSVTRGDSADKDTPDAARGRLRSDSLKAWEQPLAASKDKPGA